MTITDINESHSEINFDDNTPEEALAIRLQLIETLSCFVTGYEFLPSYRAGFFDGKKHFYDINPEMNMRIPKGLVESVLDKFPVSKPYVSLSHIPQVNIPDLKDFIKSLNLAFKPYDYQIKAFYLAISQGRKILLSATGSGKSLIIYMIMRWMMKEGRKGMLIVPNVGLVEQMRSDFIDYNKLSDNAEAEIDELVHIIYAGKEKTLEKPMTVTTWQSGILLNKEDFKQLDYVLIDEAHLAAGESLVHLLEISENCKWKIGLTGTLPKEYENRFQLAATLGKSELIVNAQGLIERGLATPVEIMMMYLNYDESEKKLVKKMKYPQETKYLEEHLHRNILMSRISIQCAEKYGNTLMLYNTISHGDFLLKLVLQEKFGINNVAVLEKITPMRIEKMMLTEPEKIFTLVPLTPKDKKNLLKYYTPEDLANKFDCLSNYDIYLIKGEVDGEKRNEIRALLEESSVDNIEIFFGDDKIVTHKDAMIPLNNGLEKKAEFINSDDDILDSWVLDRLKH